MATQQYCYPGDRVPSSGVYMVVHDRHRAGHRVTALVGDTFPYCRQCGDRVRYKLHMEAAYVFHDADFGPGATSPDSDSVRLRR